MQNNDLISRAAALNALLMSKNYRDAHDALEQLPAIDAAPVVHGRWTNGDDEYWPRATCSICGAHPWEGFIPSVETVIASGKYNYCPTCGAKLDGEEPACGPDYCEIGGGDDADGETPLSR